LDKKGLVIVLFTCVLILSLGMNYLILPVNAQPYYDAYFTSIKVTHGDNYIELINGGTAKVYDGQRVWVNLTFYNDNCGWPWGYLYTKIYQDGNLVGTSDERIVWLDTSDVDEWKYTTVYGPTTIHYKVEVWWESAGTHYLEDINEFDLKVIKLSVYNWSPSSLSVERGKTTASTWSVTFDNGGNDYMYSTSISVVDSAGLQISPMSQDLGDIIAGGTKSTTFSVTAPTTLAVNTYTVTFRIDFDDFRGISHSETKTASVDVSAPPIIPMDYTLFIIAAVIIVAGIIAVVSVLALRRRKEAPLPSPKEPTP